MPGQNRFGVRDLAAPWYAGNPSFMRAALVEPSEVPEGSIVVVGMPFDEYATTGGRTGMRWGPRAIRESSLRAIRYHANQTDVGILDIFSGNVSGWPDRLPVVDSGDVPVIPGDLAAQFEGAVEHVAEVAARSSLTVTLGGDHYVAYPACAGVIRGLKTRGKRPTVGYLHLDSHTDFRDKGAYTGAHTQGTCVRRIAELPEIKKVAWYGLNSGSEPNQFEEMARRGFKAYTSHYIKRVGAAEAMEECLKYVASEVDVLYVSVDIDVVTGADAPATGAPVFDGISGADLLAAATVFGGQKHLVGLDMCEVDPEIEGSKRTEYLAAQAILIALGRRVFKSVAVVPTKELREVFVV